MVSSEFVGEFEQKRKRRLKRTREMMKPKKEKKIEHINRQPGTVLEWILVARELEGGGRGRWV